jgi:hypothetical protein
MHFQTTTTTPTEADLDRLARPDYGYGYGRDGELWSEVLPGLWQGGTADKDARSVLKTPMIGPRQFGTVVTLYAWANPVDWFVKEIRFGIYDSDVDHFDLGELFDVVRATHADWKRGKRVLVRCQAGWNRSGLVTALVLMRDGMGAQEAIDLIRDRRSDQALCNREFVRFLLAQDPEDWRGDPPRT